jgi:hypothetical protein
MDHARSMRDQGEPCHEWFLRVSLGFSGLREAAGGRKGSKRVMGGCEEP